MIFFIINIKIYNLEIKFNSIIPLSFLVNECLGKIKIKECSKSYIYNRYYVIKPKEKIIYIV